MMRKDAYTVDSIIHVTKRGTRGMDIVRDDADRRRFVKSLFFLNDVHSDPHWHESTAETGMFERPAHWPEQEPLVRVLAWTLLSNHFHLLLQEIREGGTAKFMQKLGGSMSMCFNLKYKEKGSIFQSAYHARAVTEDAHIQYLMFYILIKNVLEMYPGGLAKAYLRFDDAWEWTKRYHFSSLPGFISGEHSPIVDMADGLIADMLGQRDSFKEEARELLSAHMSSHGKEFQGLMLESW